MLKSKTLLAYIFRYIDISLYSFMILAQFFISLVFIHQASSHRSVCWTNQKQEHFKVYQIVNFLAFGVSEFVPIALWTALKAPEDFFNLYNVLPIQKFSIFQSRIGEVLKNSRLSVKSFQQDDDGRNSIYDSRNSETDELLYSRYDEAKSF
ncbi:UNKNOWN [Stylonychia lemnae]|uniref:Uncharacterized protein n=1 Tax=Stylonychia lemnae TaxID=5949 RepID=A0A077ZTI0_STYLE|nr:UNKNOWN [Stylonychia lemnae]|eukprot:CDW73223.1 UNKNOWN [Stylonychia lemnae]